MYSKSLNSSQYKRTTTYTKTEQAKGIKLMISHTTSLARTSIYVRKDITINSIDNYC